MTDQLSGCEAEKVLDAPLRTVVGCLAEVLPKGPAQTALYWVAGICIIAAPFIYRYYLGVLAQGAQPEGSEERKDYDKLRASLAGDNLAARLYAKWLTSFLDWVERFFGDAGTADRTLFPRAFGLKTPAPLWTAPAFDRCLLLALIYPIATIFLIWTISGHVGPAEAALGLPHDLPGWRRGLAVGAIGILCVPYRLNLTQKLGWKKFFSVIAGITGVMASAIILLIVLGGSGVVIYIAGTWLAFYALGPDGFAGHARSALSGAGAVCFIVGAAILNSGGVFAAGWVFGFLVVGTAGLVYKIPPRWHEFFLALFLPAMIAACLVAADMLSASQEWNDFSPLLLFLGQLTLLNAPFDWASLGLTRALLRRGLELGGWWPYLLALVDACLAGVIIAFLALTMVIGVQAFDELAVHGGGEKAAVLPLPALFDGIAKNPAAPEYWWAYALLLSSMIPSLINLMISGVAFTRGIPWLARLLLQWIPEGKAVPEYKRQPAAIGLTVQMFAGAGLGIAAQALLAWGLIFHVMPWIGLDLLDMARAVAAFDLPTRIGQFFAATL
jgi:hypothetical protein